MTLPAQEHQADGPGLRDLPPQSPGEPGPVLANCLALYAERLEAGGPPPAGFNSNI